MERIGIAASRIAKGNLIIYNFFVIIISVLFSAVIFFIAGLAIMMALLIISYVINGILGTDFDKGWLSVQLTCLSSLALIVGIFNFVAIIKNFKISKRHLD
jgi:hypothetical protein